MTLLSLSPARASNNDCVVSAQHACTLLCWSVRALFPVYSCHGLGCWAGRTEQEQKYMLTHNSRTLFKLASDTTESLLKTQVGESDRDVNLWRGLSAWNFHPSCRQSLLSNDTRRPPPMSTEERCVGPLRTDTCQSGVFTTAAWVASVSRHGKKRKRKSLGTRIRNCGPNFFSPSHKGCLQI